MLKAYNLAGKVPVLCTAEDKKERGQESRVGEDFIGDFRISTVFVGIDSGSGNLFETVVFQGRLSLDVVRYPTWEQAEIGHNAMVDAYKFSLDPMAEGTRRCV